MRFLIMVALITVPLPALAFDHGGCVGLLADAYEAKDQMWQTAQALRDEALDTEKTASAAKAAQNEAFSANFAVNAYIQKLADLCESLR